MKILICCSNLYEETLPEFHKNKNGFSLMVRDIARSLSEFDEVYILTHVITEDRSVGDVKFVSHQIKDIVSSIKIKNVFEGIKNFFAFSMPLRIRLRYFYYAIDKGAIENVIKRIHPDIVSIHGIGYATKPYIDVCEKMHIRYSLTLHGLIGIDASVHAPKQDKLMEKSFLQYSEKKNVPVSVISTGIKRRILDSYALQHGNNITVIPNGTDIKTDRRIFENIRQKYKIPNGQFIAISVGNITTNKNQIQIVRAYDLLPETIKSKLTILFPGKEVDNGEMRNLIDKKGYANNLILCGFVEREALADYYRIADINLFVSLNDGFGLPIIEGYTYGIPAVMFGDLDAIEDLYYTEALLLAEGRTDLDLANAIEAALRKKWDRKQILLFSENFSLSDMARKYHVFFTEALNR
jgi:glycosyltransferase involved in cell wall biosynthesis